MKKYLAFAMFLILAVALVSPFSVSAKAKAGAKPGSFFYFFDKAIEKTSLFFIFNPEKKAKKTLEYAEERLAEAEELKKEKEEKETPDIKKEETEEIKTSEKEIEKMDDKLKEEKSKEKTETIIKKEETKKDEQAQEIEKLKKEIEALKQKVEKPVVIEKTQSSSSQTKQKENIVTLPNGAVVEMDENGNMVRTIKEAISTFETTNTYTPKKIDTIADTEVKKLPVWTPPSATIDYIPPSAPKEINEKCLEWKPAREGSQLLKCVKFK